MNRCKFCGVHFDVRDLPLNPSNDGAVAAPAIEKINNRFLMESCFDFGERMLQEKTNVEASYMEALDKIIQEVVEPSAIEIDRTSAFPRAALKAMGDAGLLGLISSPEVGGLGQGHRAATLVVERLSSVCGSTAMVVCMHYSATAVIEAYGPRSVREAIAQGRHISTLAFSEAGSRSHFWAPLSTAAVSDTGIQLNAHKSFATSAGQADSYVWSSRPLAAKGDITLWLLPSNASGLTIPQPFDGIGLRGNYSSAIIAKNTPVTTDAMLGADGAGFDIMLSVVLPYFQMMSAGFSVGVMEAATTKSIQHVTQAKLEHVGQSLSDLPTIRAYIARMRIKTDEVRALLLQSLNALEQGSPDAMLRVLEVKASAGDGSLEVTDLAMRVCGGAAFRKESGLERHFRDARASVIMAPTSDVLYDFIGKAVCGLPLF